jgi:hypothetical protein
MCTSKGVVTLLLLCIGNIKSIGFGAKEGFRENLKDTNPSVSPLDRMLTKLEVAAGGRSILSSRENLLAPPKYAESERITSTKGEQGLCLLNVVVGLSQPLYRGRTSSNRMPLSRLDYSDMLEDITECCTKGARQYCIDLVDPAFTELYNEVHNSMGPQVRLQPILDSTTKMIIAAQTALRDAHQKPSLKVRTMFAECKNISDSDTVIAVKHVKIQRDDENAIVCSSKVKGLKFSFPEGR